MDLAKLKALVDFDTHTVANAVELLGVRDPSGGYAVQDDQDIREEKFIRAGEAAVAHHCVVQALHLEEACLIGCEGGSGIGVTAKSTLGDAGHAHLGSTECPSDPTEGSPLG